MVPTLISEAITLCAVVKIKSPVNGSDLKFGSGDRNIYGFLNGSHIHIGSNCYFQHFPNMLCLINGSDIKIGSVD